MNIKYSIKRLLKRFLYGKPVIVQKPARVVSVRFNNILMGKTVLLTGGTSGIGMSIAEACLRSGANVIITGRKKEKLDVAIERLSALFPNTSIEGFVLDNTKPATFKQAFEQMLAISPNSQINILVNNAGLGGGEISNTSVEEYDAVMNTNLRGSFFLSKIVGDYMKSHGIKGHILNIASSSSLRPAASAYTLSKWGLRGFTLGLAKSLIPYGIIVNGLAPGPTATPMLKRDASDINFETNPNGRYAMPEEIANMAIVLMSDMANMVVGDIVYMTGGSGLITFDDITYHF